jgi:hypothetical protein
VSARTYTYDESSRLGAAHRWLGRHAVGLGFASARMVGWEGGTRRSSWIRWRGKRISFLNIPRWKWRCVLRFHHWPTPYTVVFDLCGKCCPHPCCGAITIEHADGCEEGGVS